MSRARRKPRHRRAPRLARTAAPLAVGGAVAVVALTASPLGDALRGHGRQVEARAGSGGTGAEVLLVEPADDETGDRSTDHAASHGADRSPAGTQPAAGAVRSQGRAPRSSAERVTSVASAAPADGAPSGSSPSTPGPPPSSPPPAAPGLPSLPVPAPSTTSLPPLPLPTVVLP